MRIYGVGYIEISTIIYAFILFARCIGGVNGMLGLYIAIFGAFLIAIGIRNFLKLY